jgi:hypothetical protein
MTRRWALASALLLTAIFSFFVITYGSAAGIFAWSQGDGEASPGAAFEQDAPTAVPTVPQNIVTEYVYVDEPAASLETASYDEHDDDDEWYEDDHDDDDDDDEHHHDDDDDEEHDDDDD